MIIGQGEHGESNIVVQRFDGKYLRMEKYQNSDDSREYRPTEISTIPSPGATVYRQKPKGDSYFSHFHKKWVGPGADPQAPITSTLPGKIKDIPIAIDLETSFNYTNHPTGHFSGEQLPDDYQLQPMRTDIQNVRINVSREFRKQNAEEVVALEKALTGAFNRYGAKGTDSYKVLSTQVTQLVSGFNTGDLTNFEVNQALNEFKKININ